MEQTIQNTVDVATLDPETRITQVAKELFIKKGFAETSMSEIADMAGINRPTLHYYFRTKDKMFNAVSGQIIQSILPKVQDLIDSDIESLEERVKAVVDIYYDLLSRNPGLPLFVIREIQRNANYLFQTIRYSPMHDMINHIAQRLEYFMATGQIRRLPLHILFFTFYGLLTIPLLTYTMVEQAYQHSAPNLEAILSEWKPYVVAQIVHLLKVEQ